MSPDVRTLKRAVALDRNAERTNLIGGRRVPEPTPSQRRVGWLKERLHGALKRGDVLPRTEEASDVSGDSELPPLRTALDCTPPFNQICLANVRNVCQGCSQIRDKLSGGHRGLVGVRDQRYAVFHRCAMVSDIVSTK